MTFYHWASFAPGTSILLSDGTTSKNIEDIVVGDEIYSGKLAQGYRKSVVRQIKTSTPTDTNPAEVFHIHTDDHGHLLTTTRHQAFLTIEGWQCIDSFLVRSWKDSYPSSLGTSIISKYNLESDGFFLDDTRKKRYRISQIIQDVSIETQRFLALCPMERHPENSRLIPGTDAEETSFIANGIVTRSAPQWDFVDGFFF